MSSEVAGGRTSQHGRGLLTNYIDRCSRLRTNNSLEPWAWKHQYYFFALTSIKVGGGWLETHQRCCESWKGQLLTGQMLAWLFQQQVQHVVSKHGIGG